MLLTYARTCSASKYGDPDLVREACDSAILSRKRTNSRRLGRRALCTREGAARRWITIEMDRGVMQPLEMVRPLVRSEGGGRRAAVRAPYIRERIFFDFETASEFR